MKRLKRILTIILTCSMMFVLGGCGITINTKALTNYIGTTDVGSGVVSSLENRLSISKDQLEAIKKTFDTLNVEGTGSTKFINFNDYITPMQTAISNIGDIELLNAGKVTTDGTKFMNSFYINAEEFGDARQACAQAIIEQIRRCLAHNTYSKQGLDFIDSNTTSTISDVDAFLTLFGYEVQSIEVYVPHIKNMYYTSGGDSYTLSFEDLPQYNSMWCSGNMYTAACLAVINGGTPDLTYLSTPSFTISFSQTAAPDKENATHYAFSFDNLSTDLNTQFSGFHLPACEEDTETDTDTKKYRQHNLRLVTAKTDIDEVSFDESVNKHKADGDNYETAFQKWGKDEHENYRTYMLHIADSIRIIESDSVADECTISNSFYKSTIGDATYLNNEQTYIYAEPIAAICSYTIDEDAASPTEAIRGNTTNHMIGMVYVRVKFAYKYEGEKDVKHIDIRKMGTGVYDAARELEDINAYDITENKLYSLENLKDVITTVRGAQLTVLNPMIGDAGILSKSDILSANITNTSVFSRLTDYAGNSLKVDLFEHLSEGELTTENLTEIQEVKLTIGNKPIGTFYLKTLSSDIAPSDVVETFKDNGTTQKTNVIQRFKFYSDSAMNVYCLLGLYDVGIVNGFSSTYNKDADTYTYRPLLSYNGGLTYNIFGDCLYQVGQDNGKAVMFDSEGGVQLYDSDDVAFTTVNNVSNYNTASFIADTNGGLSTVKSYIRSSKSPFVLRTYLEGLFLPDYYNSEPFICLGRRIVFSAGLFNKDKAIVENTPAFTVLNPQDELDDATTTYHTITELLGANIVNKTVVDTNYKGISRLPSSTSTDILRATSVSDTLATNLTTVNTLTFNYIYAGEFKTRSGSNFSSIGSSSRRFAQAETGVQDKKGVVTPRLFVWCTAASVNKDLAIYIDSPQFTAWQTWLNSNGYEHYLGDMTSEDLKSELVFKIEQTFNIDLNSAEEGKDIIVDITGLDKLDDWINRQTDQKTNAIIDVIIRIIAIILLVYGILLLVCYIIDVAVAGEGEGLLKKVTFNRMMSVTGMSKEERQVMSLKNEKGTYTTRAVAISDLLPVLLVLWSISTILIIGSAYDVVDTILKMAEQITQIVRGAIGKE